MVKRFLKTWAIRVILGIVMSVIVYGITGDTYVFASALPQIDTGLDAGAIPNPNHMREVDYGVNGENFTDATDQINQAIANQEEGIIIYHCDSFSEEDLSFGAFWVKDIIVFHYSGSCKVLFTYSELPAEVEKKILEIQEVMDEILSEIPDYEMTSVRLQMIHDALCRRIRFAENQTGLHARDIYGALVEGKADSAGYARAFACLARMEGIPCDVVGSKSHFWNAVYMEDTQEIYYIDVSWDDTDERDAKGVEYISYQNFMVSREQLEQNGAQHVALGKYDAERSGQHDATEEYWCTYKRQSSFSYGMAHAVFEGQYINGRNLIELRFDNEAAYRAACRALTENDMEMIWEILDDIGQLDGYEYVRWSCDDATRTFRVYLNYPA